MVTIKDVARQCNVSITTVSNVVNGKQNVSEATRRQVMDAIGQLNYTPNAVAKNLKSKKTKTLGIIVEDITVFCAPGILDGITKCCEEKGYNIVFTNLRLYEKFGDAYYNNDGFYRFAECQLQQIIAKQVDGIIYVTAHERELSCIPDNLPVPVVMSYGYIESDKYPSVFVDDETGAYELVKYVISQGHRRIGVIAGKHDSIHTNNRMSGYKKALMESGIEYDDKLVVEGDWTRESGFEKTDELLDQNVTAIFCMNDIMAGGVYSRLEEEGLVPGDDISVVGYDDRELSRYMNPPLTTMSIPLKEIGYQAALRIIAQIESVEILGEDGTISQTAITTRSVGNDTTTADHAADENTSENGINIAKLKEELDKLEIPIAGELRVRRSVKKMS